MSGFSPKFVDGPTWFLAGQAALYLFERTATSLVVLVIAIRYARGMRFPRGKL